MRHRFGVAGGDALSQIAFAGKRKSLRQAEHFHGHVFAIRSHVGPSRVDQAHFEHRIIERTGGRYAVLCRQALIGRRTDLWIVAGRLRDQLLQLRVAWICRRCMGAPQGEREHQREQGKCGLVCAPRVATVHGDLREKLCRDQRASLSAPIADGRAIRARTRHADPAVPNDPHGPGTRRVAADRESG